MTQPTEQTCGYTTGYGPESLLSRTTILTWLTATPY